MSQEIVNKLNDAEKLTTLSEEIERIIAEDSVSEAKKILASLEGILENNPDIKALNSGLFKLFEGFVNGLKFVILFDLPDKDIISLLKNDLSFVVEHPDYDLKTKFNYKIRTIYDLVGRDSLKENVRRVLLENKTPMFNKKIRVANVEQSDTVSAWLKDYLSKVGLEQVNKLKFNEYLFSDQNTKSLTEDERLSLKRILNFFESLKISSQEVPIAEESFTAILPNGDLVAMVNGQPEKIDQNIFTAIKEISKIDDSKITDVLSSEAPTVNPKIAELEKLLVNYPPSSLEYKAIQQEIRILQKFIDRKNNVQQ